MNVYNKRNFDDRQYEDAILRVNNICRVNTYKKECECVCDNIYIMNKR